MMDDDINDIKIEEKNIKVNNNQYIPSGNPVNEDNNNQYNNDVKGVSHNNRPNQDNNFNTNNFYGVGLEVENLTIDPKPQFQPFYPPNSQAYQPYNNQQAMATQFSPQFYGTQVNQFNAGAPYAGGFYGGSSQGGMVMPGIPIQVAEQIPINRNGQPINQNGAAIILIEGDQQIRQSLIFRIRKNTKWFTGCNACFTILLVINLLNKISLYNSEESSSSRDRDGMSNSLNNNDDDDEQNGKEPNNLLRASAVISIIEYIIWFIFIILAIHGLTSNKLHLVRYYIKGLIFCISMEVLANILIFAGFGDSSPVKKVSFVIVFILTILILYSFIKNAKNLLQDIEQYKSKFGGNPISDQLNPNLNNINGANNNNNNMYNQNMVQANVYNNQVQYPYRQPYQNGAANNNPVRY